MITWRFAVQLNRSLVEIVGLVIEKTQVIYIKSFSWVVVKKTFQVTSQVSFCAYLGETLTDWKKARLILVYKKDDEDDTNNYSLVSLLSVPSKIMESCVPDTVVRHVYQKNLVTDKQWAYREGHLLFQCFNNNVWVKMKTKWKLSAKFRVYSLV